MYISIADFALTLDGQLRNRRAIAATCTEKRGNSFREIEKKKKITMGPRRKKKFAHYGFATVGPTVG